MKFARIQEWTNDLKEAARIQESLAAMVDTHSYRKEYDTIAGVDVAYSKKDSAVFASIVTMKFPELVPLEKVRAQSYVSFAYIPGFLYFREGPVIAKALERLQTVPDVIMFDAGGIAHPKRFGMASHFGVMLDIPTIGCAKKKLTGNFRALPDEFGARSPLEEGDEVLGYAVRSRVGVKPLFVSPGHKIDNETAVEVVLSTIRGYRLPEPLRVAHILVNKMRRNYDSRQGSRQGFAKRD